MGDQGRWYKLWTTAPDDPHLGNLSLEDFARWCLFGIYMKVHGTNGIVSVERPMVALCRALRVAHDDDAITLIRKFPHCSVSVETNSPVTYSIRWENWQKYQGDYSTHRVRKWRAEQRTRETPKKRREEKRREAPLSPSPLPSEAPFEGFLETLRKNPAYKGIDVERELQKMDAWLSTPAGRGRKKTQRFVLNWLNRIDVALPPGKSQARRLWEEAQCEKEGS